MAVYIKMCVAGLICILAACASTVENGFSSIEEHQRVADTFISHIISEDYTAAYTLFRSDIQQKYPYGLFSNVQKQINKRFGKPVEYSFQKESDVDPFIAREFPDAVKSYVYTVVFEKRQQKSSLPLLITFDQKKSAAQLLSYRFLME